MSTRAKFVRVMSLVLLTVTALWLLSCEEADYVMYPNPVTVMWERTYDIGDSYESLTRTMLVGQYGHVGIAGTARYEGQDDPPFMLIANTLGDSVAASTFETEEPFRLKDVVQCSDGGYLLLGNRTVEPRLVFEIHLIRTDATLRELWSKPLGAPRKGYASTFTAMGNESYVVTGLIESDTAEGRHVFLECIDANGDILWTRNLDNFITAKGNISATSSNDNGLVIFGITNGSDSTTQAHQWLAKIDLQGDLVWSKRFSVNTHEIHFGSVTEGLNGDLYLLRRSYDLDNDEESSSIARTNSTGDLLWSKQIYQSKDCGLVGIAEVSPSRIVAVGTRYREDSGYYDSCGPYIVVVDRSGHIIREMMLDYPRDGYLMAVKADHDGNILALGGTTMDIYLVKLDASRL